jgi:hypothetical protein
LGRASERLSGVAEVLLITFQRPASMTKSEMSAVLRERGRAAPRRSPLGRADGR